MILLHYLIYPLIAIMFIIATTGALQLVIKSNMIFYFVYFLITFVTMAIYSAFVYDDVKILVSQNMEIFSLSLFYFVTQYKWSSK